MYASIVICGLQLRELAGKAFAIQEEGKTTSAVFLPYQGQLEEFESFNSIVVALVGKFLYMIRRCGGDVHYGNRYQDEELTRSHKQLCFDLIIELISRLSTVAEKTRSRIRKAGRCCCG